MSAHVNGAHEREVKRMILEEAPGMLVSISSEVNPQIREYERTSTTAIDACVKPLADQYFSRLEKALADAGFRATLLIMKSSGAHRDYGVMITGSGAGHRVDVAAMRALRASLRSR
jgi:N-methylhydantoinase A